MSDLPACRKPFPCICKAEVKNQQGVCEDCHEQRNELKGQRIAKWLGSRDALAWKGPPFIPASNAMNQNQKIQ